MSSSSAVAADGTIDVATADYGKHVVALNPDGTIKWQYPAGSLGGSPAIGEDGTIYFTGNQYDWDIFEGFGLFAVNPDGSLKWRYEIGGGGFYTPIIDANGTLYVPGWTLDYQRTLYAFRDE